MATKRQQEAMNLYLTLMEELKIRLNCIAMAAAGATGLPHSIAREICFLQLRMICEVIGFGCLVAHGDIEATKVRRFQDKYHPGEIMTGLEKLHPDFYPHPITSNRTAPNAHSMEIITTRNTFLAKD